MYAVDFEILWRVRHARPAVAAEHVNENFVDERAHPRLATLGRHESIDALATMANRIPAGSSEEWLEVPEVLTWLEPRTQEEVRAHVVSWAKETRRFSGLDDLPLRAALEMSWGEVGELLCSNEHAVPGLLAANWDRDFRSEGRGRPGILNSADALLAWSALVQNAFLARLAATATTTDISAIAAEVDPAGGYMEYHADTYRIWEERLQPVLAITWLRCRPSLDA